jgi:hypothetical protein
MAAAIINSTSVKPDWSKCRGGRAAGRCTRAIDRDLPAGDATVVTKRRHHQVPGGSGRRRELG